MKNPSAPLFRSVFGYLRRPRHTSADPSRQPTDRSLSREQFRELLIETLEDPTTARAVAQRLLLPVFPIAGGQCGGPNASEITAGTFGCGAYTFQASAATIVPLTVKGFASQSADLQQWRTSGGNVLATLSAAGKVGIGTTTLNARLTIASAVADLRAISLGHDGGSGSGNGAAIVGSRDNSSNVPFTGVALWDSGSTTRWIDIGGGEWGNPDANMIRFWTAPTYIETANTAVQRMIITPDGNVGIGTAAPQAKLEVIGNVRIGPQVASTLFVGNGNLTSPKQVSFGPEMINAAAPDRRVVLWAGDSDDAEAMFMINSNGILEWGPGGSGDQDIFLSRKGADQLTLTDTFAVAQPGEAFPRIALKHDGTGIYFGNATDFPDVSISRPGPNQLYVNGALGIGTSSPQTLLDVAGQARVKPVTFAALPAASSAIEGAIAAVTDSTTNAWGATIAGGGSNHVLAYCNGTNWTVAGR